MYNYILLNKKKFNSTKLSSTQELVPPILRIRNSLCVGPIKNFIKCFSISPTYITYK